MDKDAAIEISQVANGFIIRPSFGWYGQDTDGRRWAGTSSDYIVFRTMNELLEFVKEHFTHRSSLSNPDR